MAPTARGRTTYARFGPRWAQLELAVDGPAAPRAADGEAQQHGVLGDVADDDEQLVVLDAGTVRRIRTMLQGICREAI
jgi:hypothetical protein